MAASFGQIIISALFSPTTYESTFGVYAFPRNCLFKALAFAAPTNTREMSHPGNTSPATLENIEGCPRYDRVRFLMAIAILRLALTALARLLRGRVYLTELYELVVGLAPHLRDERALVTDVL